MLRRHADKQITKSSLPTSLSGNEYNINVRVYVNDYNYRKKKTSVYFEISVLPKC